MNDCIFCKIVAGSSPCHKIWEDEKHLAFLSIYPNTPGFSVVIPKAHCSSYAFSASDDDLSQLVLASKKVALLLDATLEGVGRTGFILEGYGIDHLHAKLFPMHGTGSTSDFKQISSKVDKYFDKYEGYISSHDWQRADDNALAALAAKIAAKRE
ncbi:HIT family protein [Pseudomonas sp. NPDC089734]|uniref:HIT family protein n=1 Tax=Pseudomonas sp. NPDC089734 TaxID=3364469 RepID=UPI00382ACBE0